jgi:hypothetical protein
MHTHRRVYLLPILPLCHLSFSLWKLVAKIGGILLGYPKIQKSAAKIQLTIVSQHKATSNAATKNTRSGLLFLLGTPAKFGCCKIGQLLVVGEL